MTKAVIPPDAKLVRCARCGQPLLRQYGPLYVPAYHSECVPRDSERPEWHKRKQK